MIVAIGLIASLAGAQPHDYSIGSWPESGRGNHRAVVCVDAPAEAVLAHIEWRRRDQRPEEKAVFVFDAATGERVRNVVALRAMTREFGDIVFEPPTTPGDYHIYYLPYHPPGTGPFGDAGTYLPAEDTADPAWLEGLSDELPRAEVVGIQARAEFHRMDPMEVIATRAETDGLLADYPDVPYLLFPEDREHPIRMFEDLPWRWIERGPSLSFAGEARPNEYYVFQIGVFAARQDVRDLTVEFSSLTDENGHQAAGSDQLTSFSAALTPEPTELREGMAQRFHAGAMFPLGHDLRLERPAFPKFGSDRATDGFGMPRPGAVTVGAGRIRPLWLGIDVPEDAEGMYQGMITLRAEGLEPREFGLTLNVSGDALDDKGDSELWRLSRLRWLNSTLGREPELTPPYTPVERDGDAVRILGRRIQSGRLGMPESIQSNEREILAAPVSLAVDATRGPVKWRVKGSIRNGSERGPTRLVMGQTFTTRVGDLDLFVGSITEFDGCLSFSTELTANEAVDLSDVRLKIPIRRDVAKYMMGFGKRGGVRPEEWRWKWDVERANNSTWLGDWNAGLQLKLLGDTNPWQMSDLKDTGLPKGWDNEGRGGCDVTEDGDTVLVSAYTGERKLEKGQEVRLNFRLLVTPFKPIDPRHWDWRYGNVRADGTVMHIHHATPQNPYINYPFLTTDQLKGTVDSVKTFRTRRVDLGELIYPAAGNINPDRGTLHVWARVNFDPAAGAAKQAVFNQPLFNLDFPNQDSLGFYWNIDDRGMRAYVRHGAPENNRHPVLFGTHQPEWKQGERHLLTVTWGEHLGIFVDGVLAHQTPWSGTSQAPIGDAVMMFGGGFALDAIKVTDESHVEGMAIEPVVDDHTLLLDTFDAWDGGEETQPERATVPGRVTGVCEKQGSELAFSAREIEVADRGVNVYYTIRELTNRLPEIWALRSMDDEVYVTSGQDIYDDFDVASHTPVGYAWLREHLVAGYVPAWRSRLSEDEIDTAIAQQGVSRWHNYYVEGMRRLMHETGIDGLYLDGIGYDRETIKRIARVMHAADPNYRINFHSGDGWSPPWDPERLISPANLYMEHFPYISNLWFGELFDYDMPPDYWLVEISGIPFGLTGEMLNYQTGGNPYRGMIYGMDGRQNASCTHLWRLWDEFGIADAEWLGYWDSECPVRTDRSDVLATVYRKEGKSLIALAHWPTEERLPQAAVTGADASPAIDGTLEPGEWDGAAKLTNFTNFGTVDLAAEQTDVYVTHDAERLYIGFRCEHAAKGIKADAAARDGDVYLDDALELFIQPDPDDGRYVQFVGNSIGTYRDAEGLDASWDAEWEYETSRGEGFWSGELSVTFADLGIQAPRPNTPIGLNICRDRQTPSARASVWSPARDTFHDVDRFGRLTLAADHAATREGRRAPGQDAETVPVRLRVDWEALGIDRDAATLTAPRVGHFQAPAWYGPDDVITIPASKGCLLIVE